MHRSILSAAALAVLALGACEGGVQAGGPSAAEPVNATADLQGIASVVDGDTIEIRGERIRLSGFDTPERGAMCGTVNVYQRAATELDSFIAGRTVSCQRTGQTAIGRSPSARSVASISETTSWAAAGVAIGRDTAKAGMRTRSKRRERREQVCGG